MAAPFDQDLVLAFANVLTAVVEEASARGAERGFRAALAASNTTAGASTARRLAKRREAAAELAVSLATFDRLRRRGLPEVRVGASSRFDVDQCRRWLDEHGRDSTGNAGESNEQR